MARKRILVQVSNDGNGYSAHVLLSGEHKGGTQTLVNGICDEFTAQTGISLKKGTSKVYRMELIPQKKRAAKK